MSTVKIINTTLDLFDGSLAAVCRFEINGRKCEALEWIAQHDDGSLHVESTDCHTDVNGIVVDGDQGWRFSYLDDDGHDGEVRTAVFAAMQKRLDEDGDKFIEVYWTNERGAEVPEGEFGTISKARASLGQTVRDGLARCTEEWHREHYMSGSFIITPAELYGQFFGSIEIPVRELVEEIEDEQAA
jgi:hypothetical protein